MKNQVKTKKEKTSEEVMLKAIKDLTKIISENKSPKVTRNPDRERGCFAELWSDGEYRIHEDLISTRIHTRYMLGDKQICFRMSEVHIPKIGDVIEIRYLNGDENINLMTKVFEEVEKIEYQFTQYFSFTVDSIKKLMDYGGDDFDGIEYIINLKPNVALTRKTLIEKA